MEIDAPSHAVGLWIEGDHFLVRFPDRQLVSIPVCEAGRLINVLRARSEYAARAKRMSIGTDAAPVQYDLDQIRKHLARHPLDTDEQRANRAAERAERDRKALLRRANKRQKIKEADELLTLVGLA